MRGDVDHGGRVLVIFPGALGDLICAMPAIRALTRRRGAASIASIELMARAELVRLAVGRLGFAHGHSIDRREIGQLFVAPAEESPAARAFIGGFDQVYSFFASAESSFRAALASAANGRASFYPFRPPGEGHVAACYLRAVGAEPAIEPAEPVGLFAEDLEMAQQRLSRLGFERGGFVLIFPGSGSRTKNWPAEKFATLAQGLPAPMRALVVLGPAEAGLESDFVARNLAVVAGLELAEVAALARLSAAFVGNDSGVSHLAAAAGGRGIAIFGPTDPLRWRPIGQVEVIRREPLGELAVGEVADRLIEIAISPARAKGESASNSPT